MEKLKNQVKWIYQKTFHLAAAFCLWTFYRFFVRLTIFVGFLIKFMNIGLWNNGKKTEKSDSFESVGIDDDFGNV